MKTRSTNSTDIFFNTRREDYQNMVGHVRNRALQIIMLENDYGQVRERLEHQVFHGNTVTYAPFYAAFVCVMPDFLF